MKGHIRKRGEKSWAIVLDIGRDENGKRRQKWHSVRGIKKEAEAEMSRLLNEMNTGAYVEPARMSVRDYLDKWLADYAKHNVAGKTYERYDEIVRNYLAPELGSTMLPKLKPLHIQSFYSKLLASGRRDGKGGLSAQTVLHCHRVLNAALKQAVRWQLLARNPAEAVQPPRPERTEMRALDEAETATLLRLLSGTRLYPPVLLAATTGLRRGEILALRWEDLDFEKRTLRVAQSLEQTKDGLRFKAPKTHRSRRLLALPAIAADALKAHKVAQAKERLALGRLYQDHGLVCPRQDGTPWPPDMLSTAFAAFVARSDALPHVRFHDLRHTHATQLLRAGVHPKVVSERLGHSAIGITLDTYSHVLPGMQEDAVSLVDAALRRAVAEGYDETSS
jgi:integrase